MNSAQRPADTICAENTFVISARLAGGRVAGAWSTGKMVHNMDFLLGANTEGETPRFAKRPACICNDGHALAAARAVEDLAGVQLPEAARLVRNLAQSLQLLSDHLTHFYHFSLSDWLNLGRALRADTGKTARLAERTCPRPDHGRAAFYGEALQRLNALAKGEGGEFFSVSAWDHPAYAGGPEAHLLVFSHSQAALAIRAKLAEAQKLLRCTGPDHPAYQIGGLSEAADGGPDLSAEARSGCAELLRQCAMFIQHTFLSDALLVAHLYRQETGIGQTGAFLSWGDFPLGQKAGALFPGGVFTLGRELLAQPAAWNQVRVEEEPAWADVDANRYRLRFGALESGYRWTNDSFKWFAVPRYAGLACEAGPLSRVLGACALGDGPVRQLVADALRRADLPVSALNSTVGRMLARGLEAASVAQAALRWLDELDEELRGGKVPVQARWSLPDSGEGVGLAEIGRGALAHTLRLENGRVVRHNYLIPSLWNFSPRSGDGTPSPLEQALASTPVANSSHPLEILRTVHAFDPCNACVIRLEDDDAGKTVTVRAK
jgi:Ni,Fe-hydrogenase I large subunit